MTKEIAQKLAGLTPRNLVVVVSRWSTMPIKENIDTAPKFNVLSRLSELLDMISPHSYLELGRFAKDCGIIANVYRDAGGNRRVTLIRETRKYRSIVDIDPLVSTANEFDSCVRLILTNYQGQLEQVLAVPGGSPR